MKIYKYGMPYDAPWAFSVRTGDDPLFLRVEAVRIWRSTHLVEDSKLYESWALFHDHSYLHKVTLSKLEDVCLALSTVKNRIAIELVSFTDIGSGRQLLVALDPSGDFLVLRWHFVLLELVPRKRSTVTPSELEEFRY
jgi:hypothetical protein